MKKNSWKIKVNIDGDQMAVCASLNGKHIDMSDKASACNIAGMLAQVSVIMVKHFNRPSANKNNNNENKENHE